MDNSLIVSPLVLDSANESIAEPFTVHYEYGRHGI